MTYLYDASTMTKLISRFLDGHPDSGVLLIDGYGLHFHSMKEIDAFQKLHPKHNGQILTGEGYPVNKEKMREKERKEQAMISQIERQKIRELLHDAVDECTFVPGEEIVVTDSGVEIHVYCMPDRFTRIELRIE